MAGRTKEVRTIMFSVEGKNVVTHKLPFDANDPIGRLKLQKFLHRGFTYDDPRLKVKTGQPQVIVTQEVNLEKPIDGNGVLELAADVPEPDTIPVKKWKNMNAKERKAYQLAKKEEHDGILEVRARY